VLYVGGGVLKAGASAALQALAEQTGLPVVTTLMARGAFPTRTQQHLGMPGMHGTVAAVYALQKSDLIVALGARFDDRVTGSCPRSRPTRTIVHADIDPAEIGKNRHADVPIVGDAPARHRRADRGRRRSEHNRGHRADLTEWWATLNDLRERYPLGYEEPPDGTLAPQYVIKRIGEIVGPGRDLLRRRRASTRCGPAQFHLLREPGHLAQLRRPGHDGLRGAGRDGRQARHARHGRLGDRRRRLLPDDQPGAGHLRAGGIPIKVAVINNGNLGMVRQWQTLFYDQRYSNTDLGTHKHRIPTSSSSPRRWAASGCAARPPRTSTPRSRRPMRHQRPAGRDRLRGRQGCDGVADGGRRHQQ
jgi:acetolactate synthase-1/2/3 large subunit